MKGFPSEHFSAYPRLQVDAFGLWPTVRPLRRVPPGVVSGLRVQMCVMLAGLAGFEARTNDNKVLAPPFAACKDATGRRWVVTGWERCGRAWGNPPCPCVHAGPVVPDCPPGESRAVRGWLSFYEGDDVDAERRRLAAVAFR